ncbi:hypothetical protein GQ44DRAFT_755597 [Phaeosphaeriaceae sp. PMI808]|nr:hypothetical protein GQ44DRAFT_755597 [Phaeosphaeriaceae sp. PMI808]
MLSRRRAYISSASCLHRRACDEITVNCDQTFAPHKTLITPQKASLCRVRPLLVAMQTTTPPPTSSTSPTSTPNSACNWKRGRPVSAPYGNLKWMNGTPGLFSQHPSLQFTQRLGPIMMARQGQFRQASNARRTLIPEEQRADASVSNTSQHMRLSNSPQIVGLPVTTPMEMQYTLPTVDDSIHLPQLHIVHDNSSNRLTTQGDTAKAVKGMSRHIEQHRFPNNDPTSQDNTNMEQSNDSDYLLSQDSDNSAIEQPDDEKSGNGVEPKEEEVEEHIPLEYQIPDDVLRAAILAAPNTHASFWSHKMYRGSDGQKILVHYCKSMEVAERVAKKFQEEKVLGFDIEWKTYANPNSIKQNVSLIQLASEDRIALFHISQFRGNTIEELMPPTLKAILESPDIYKVGACVKGDFTRLQNHLNIQGQGVFELSRLHHVVELHATDPTKVSNKPVGLAAQVLQHLQLPLYKGTQLDDDPESTPNVRVSDWSTLLQSRETHYAAADAYAGFRLYHILEWKRKQLRPIPATRGLCDYDAKPGPRVNKPKNKKNTAKPKDTDQAFTERCTSDQGKGEDGYETAPEDLFDSHELENLVSASSASEEQDILSQKKVVGRIKLSWLKGPDPGYPILPQEPEEYHITPASSHTLDSSANTCANNQPVISLSGGRLAPSEVYAEDEFPDPELEMALQVLEVDIDGTLKESTRSSCAAAITKRIEQATSAPGPTALKRVQAERDGASLSTSQEVNNTITSDHNPLRPKAFGPTAFPPTTLETTHPLANEVSHTPEYNAATAWARSYLCSIIPSPTSTLPSRIRATVPHLRAYHLWYHQHFSIENIASYLRDPPLSYNTVAGYILQAVSLERLEYENEAMRNMMIGMPVTMRKGRWASIAEKVGALN